MKKTLALLLAILMCLALLPAAAAEQANEAASEPETENEGSNTRLIHNGIIVDSDPTDGYDGDYVVIYNPSLSAYNSVSTGNLTGLIETTVEPNVVADPGKKPEKKSDRPYRIDIDSALEERVQTAEPEPASEPLKATYTVGSTKTFTVTADYYPTGQSSVTFKCLYVGEHCYIWTPASSSGNTYPLDGIDTSYAKIAADEFDSKFDLMQSSFGNHDTSLDEKLHMLYYNIEDGWTPGQGYIAGFFYAYDLMNNNLPILNIDTYPGVYYANSSGQTYQRIEDTFNTMVHEYQHLINYCNAGLPTWLNESFSAAAEEICYPGSSVVGRIQSWENYYYSDNGDWLNPPAEFGYQSSYNLHNGYSMYSWSNSLSDVLALYAQVSLFAQYLFTRFGNTIYKQISQDYASQGYYGSETTAITNATGVNCSDLVRDFRIAVTANASQNDYDGVYGFKPQSGYDPAQYHNVQNPYNLLAPIIFTGSTCTIKGGGAITVKPVGGNFTPPSGADSGLKYFGITLASPYTVTAVSNNEAWGSVSVDGTKITASPAAGYYAADYEVLSGSATAVISGNIIRVTPESDCTIQIIFAPKPSYTVNFVVCGSEEASSTALIYDTITLPGSVGTAPEGWTFIGWTETRLSGETESKPVYYAPGASYTVMNDVTLYAVFSRVEEGVGEPVYELVSSAPSDWSGNYAISFRNTNSSASPMYLMKGTSVSTNGSSIESAGNASQYAVTGATLDGTTLHDVADEYLFALEKHGSYYSIQNVSTSTYVGINGSGYLAGYRTYASGNCDWTPGTKTNCSSATVAAGGTYPLLSFYIDGAYFWAGSSNATAALYVRFWKEAPGDATYYATDPVVHTHIWGEPTYTWNKTGSNWTCTASRLCTGEPSHEQTETVTATAAVTKPATCTATGETTYTARFTNTAFTEQTKVEEDIAALGHDLVHHNAQAPTCTEVGWNAYDTCTRCDYTTYGEIAALGHDLIHHDAQAPTCSEVGWNAYDTCSRCDYSTYVEIPTLAHELIHHDAKDPTCTEIGWYAYDTCANCDYSTYVEIPALGHDLIHHDAKDPTCTEVGWNAYDTCSRCDYTTYEEIPALGHNPGDPVKENEVAPSYCTEGHYDEVVYCTRCHAELSRETHNVDRLPFEGTVTWNEEDVAFKGATAYVIANGSAQTPRFTVTDADENVVDPANYTYEFRENVNAGTGYLFITFQNDYTGSTRASFKIYLPATAKTTIENTADGILLTWEPVEGAAGYVIYRRAWSTTTDGWTAFARWDNTTELNYLDGHDDAHKVYAGTRYQYGVKAYFARRLDPIAGMEIGGNVNNDSGNFNLGLVGPLKTTVRITTRTLKSVTAGTKQMTVKWAPSKNFTGYQIRYALHEDFTGAKTVKINDAAAASYVIKSLKSGKTYYVQVRSYQLFEGMTYYGGWSNVLNCKVK